MKIVHIEITEPNASIFHKFVKDTLRECEGLPTVPGADFIDAVTCDALQEWVNCLAPIVKACRRSALFYDEVFLEMPKDMLDKIPTASVEECSKMFDNFLNTLDPKEIESRVSEKMKLRMQKENK